MSQLPPTTHATATGESAGSGPSQRKTFVLDTSVLLSDPGAVARFGDYDVVLPLVVIGELEGKRHHPELGWFARQTLRLLDDLRIKHGRLDVPVPMGEDGGTLHVELNHSDLSSLPAGFRVESNDSRILAVALNLANEGRAVTLVTKDMPLRVKAAAVGLPADEYQVHPAVVDSGWTGMTELDGVRRGGRFAVLRRPDRDHRERGAAAAGRRCPATPGWCCTRRAARRWPG